METPGVTESLSFEERLAAKKAKLAAEGRLTPPTLPTPPSLPTLPTAPSVTFMSPKRDETLDRVVDELDIISAYNQYAGKGMVDPGGRTESIKVRCPNPSHPDNDPSAWINTDKQTWYCGSCAEGGDKFDIAAWYFGMPVPGYKDGRNFHELRERIAASRGYTVTRAAGVTTVVESSTVQGGGYNAPAPVRQDAVTDPTVGPDGAHIEVGPPVAPFVDAPAASVTDLADHRAAPLELVDEIELDWKPLAPVGTFLDIYMKQVIIDDVPEEYHFWNGLLAIAAALGRDATLADLRPVYGNLFICILGRTGAGKSKAKYLLDLLLHEALPYSITDPFSKGILRANAPASAEALIWMFQKKIKDPSTGKEDNYPVRGIVDYNELSSLVGRTQRSGNVLTPTLMQFYDMEPTVSTTSRTHGTELAIEPYACAVTTSQPKSLKGLLTTGDAASGALNRWFFAVGKSKPRIAVGGTMPDIKPAVKPLQAIQGWASVVKQISWSQEALDEFELFFRRTIEPTMKRDETDLLSRLDLLCKKLILLFTANMQHRQVQIEAVKQMEHMFDYILQCYGVPGAQVGSTLQEEIRTDILKSIVSFQTRKGMGPTARDINQLIKQKKHPLDLFNKTLKHMVEIEEISSATVAPVGGRGRFATRYTVESIEDAKLLLKVLNGELRREKEAAK